MNRRIELVAVLACLSVTSLACGGNEPTNPSPDPAASPITVTIVPQSHVVGINDTVRFVATIKLSDGSTTQAPVAWTATGGTMDPSGRYLGGTATGDYQVIASTVNGLADTAAVILGLPISASQPVQSMVDANPAGATFILKSGTHSPRNIIPKSGDRFIGEPGAVLDGQGLSGSAFAAGPAPYPSNVTIRGLKVTGYEPSFQRGAIDAGGSSPSEGTTGWIIDSNEVAYNGEYGIRIGNSMQITNNNVHHNKRLNIAGSGSNTLIARNEIAFGHYLNAFDANFEAGGTKFTYTDGLVLQNNYVHDNVGVGLHLDLNNINAVIDGNQIDHNGSDGIVIEISYRTAIRNNTVTDNGWFDPRNRYVFLWNAGIGIHGSPDVEIYGNTVAGNYAGVVAIEQDRQRDPASHGPHIVQNLDIHDNTITQTNLPRTENELSVAAGVATDIPSNSAMFSSRNNRFTNNTYYLGPNPTPFAWRFGVRTEAEWKAYGQDVNGRFNR
jgi:parallel beta-helix repeat protein